jgi:hypothetical protein
MNPTKWEKLLLLMHWKFTEQLYDHKLRVWDVYVVGVVGGSGAGTWEIKISNFES